MSKIKKKPIVFFVIALIALYIIIYIIPKVTGALVSAYTVEYGELKVADETKGFLVRNEKVYISATSGKENRYIKGGTLVRSGTTVMEVTGNSESEVGAEYTDMLTRLGNDAISTSDFSVAEGGVVSYYADGYEGKIRPDNMEKGTYEYYSKLSQDNVVNLARNAVAKGEPVFKIADRTKWYIVCFIDKKHLDRYTVGQEVTVEFEDDFVRAKVYKADEQDGKGRVILVTDYYYEKFAKTRVADISLVTDSGRGLIIENSSITEEKGMPGVYVKNKTNDYNFVPIQVIVSDGEKSLVKDTFFHDTKKDKTYDTIEIYDVVLKDPK